MVRRCCDVAGRSGVGGGGRGAVVMVGGGWGVGQPKDK